MCFFNSRRILVDKRLYDNKISIVMKTLVGSQLQSTLNLVISWPSAVFNNMVLVQHQESARSGFSSGKAYY
jgi:hypothetical protein